MRPPPLAVLHRQDDGPAPSPPSYSSLAWGGLPYVAPAPLAPLDDDAAPPRAGTDVFVGFQFHTPPNGIVFASQVGARKRADVCVWGGGGGGILPAWSWRGGAV